MENRVIHIDLGNLDHVIPQNLGDTRANELVIQLINLGFSYNEISLALDVIIEIVQESKDVVLEITNLAFTTFAKKTNNLLTN